MNKDLVDAFDPPETAALEGARQNEMNIDGLVAHAVDARKPNLRHERDAGLRRRNLVWAEPIDQRHEAIEEPTRLLALSVEKLFHRPVAARVREVSTDQLRP